MGSILKLFVRGRLKSLIIFGCVITGIATPAGNLWASGVRERVVSSNSFFSPGKWGAGVVLGNITALTARYGRDGRTALDMGLALSMSEYLLLYSDYLIKYASPQSVDPFLRKIYSYYGVGGLLVSTTKSRCCEDRYFPSQSGAIGLAARFPMGIEWSPGYPPIGVFFELVPGISILPRTEIFVGLFLGIRYFF